MAQSGPIKQSLLYIPKKVQEIETISVANSKIVHRSKSPKGVIILGFFSNLT